MKTLYSLLILLSSGITTYAQQFTLYNEDGEAGAYIDYDKDATLFSWGGEPVGFLQTEDNVVRVFSFNGGDVIGYYEAGLLYDKKGFVVAAKKGALVHKAAQTEQTKGTQKIVPIKPITTVSIASAPALKNDKWSELSLGEFLLGGKK